MGRLDNNRRHPTDVAHSNSRSAQTNIVTYRFNQRMVYVTPADSYEQAVDYAKSVFPDELKDVNSRSIAFSVSVNTPDGPQTVQIGPMAWSAVINTLARFEIIDIVVSPEVVIEDMDAPLPNYADVTNKEHSDWSDSKAVATSRSAPTSRDRTPSPAGQGRRAKAMSWIETHLPVPHSS